MPLSTVNSPIGVQAARRHFRGRDGRGHSHPSHSQIYQCQQQTKCENICDRRCALSTKWFDILQTYKLSL